MRPIQQLLILRTPSLRFSLSKPCSLLSESNCSSAEAKDTNLTSEELTKINLLIPRLCESNHLREAIRLIDAALLTKSPLKSLSISVLIDRLVAETDMIHSMAFLNRLKHNPTAHSALIPINRMLLVSYFKKRKLTEAMKVFNWMSRPDSPCYPDAMVFGVIISGFCLNGMTLEALRILRAMVGSNVIPGAELRIRVYKSLLREARIKEAQALNEALGSVGDESEGLHKVLELFDHMINNWTD